MLGLSSLNFYLDAIYFYSHFVNQMLYHCPLSDSWSKHMNNEQAR